MKKVLSVLLMVGLVVGSLAMPAEAGKKKKKKKVVRVERTVESVYQAPAIGSPSAGGACPNATNSCAEIATGAEDKYVKVSVEDATGTAVAFSLAQDTDEATLGSEVDMGVFCGTTGDETIAVQAPGVPLLSFVWAFGDIICPGGVATTGTVSATFSNLP
jgi:hypothetical protein